MQKIKQGYAMVSIEDLRELLNAKSFIDAIFDEVRENGYFCSTYRLTISDAELKALFSRTYKETEEIIDVQV